VNSWSLHVPRCEGRAVREVDRIRISLLFSEPRTCSAGGVRPQGYEGCYPKFLPREHLIASLWPELKFSPAANKKESSDNELRSQSITDHGITSRINHIEKVWASRQSASISDARCGFIILAAGAS
jgi:hypothetical protein